jgi:Cell wall-active antibiotics response LiaF, C-terminal
VRPEQATPAGVGGSPLVVRGPARQNHLAIMSGLDRRGHWVVPQSMNVLALMGGANLDLREAQFAAREVVLTVTAIMGGADIVVPPHVNVIVEGIGIMGGFSGPSGKVPAELTPDSPTVRIRGLAFWGGVNVRRRAVRGPEAPEPGGPHQRGH